MSATVVSPGASPVTAQPSQGSQPFGRAGSLYLAHPIADYGLIGGISILFLSVLWFFPHSVRPTAWSIAWANAAAFVINYPHFSATAFRLYHSRRNIAQYPVTAVGIPLFLVAACAMGLAEPQSFGPYLVKVMLIWSPYHFCGQALGISMLYARRAGLYVERWERLALSATLFTLYFTLQVRGELDDSAYFGVIVPYTGLPSWLGNVGLVLCVISTLTLLVAIVRWIRRTGRMVPPIILLPTVSLFVWFVLGYYNGSFRMFVPAFHALQYLFIAGAMQLREKWLERGAAPTARFVTVEMLRWAAVNVAIGVGLFVGLPWALGRAVSLDPQYTKGVLLAAIQLHHFFVDGVIWKLKSRTVSAPLSATLRELQPLKSSA
jgi:hypothetical protein